ncbi:MAG: hypothetical protein COA70_13275 [Planctomycetota bacterium]|nr:MAG: hypothetical protein COA70_13275 [Planctomycetota bacterium]
MRSSRNIFSILLLAAFAVLAIGSSSSESETEEAIANEAPELTVAAISLCTDYDGNEIAGDLRYKDKTILVTGTIESIGKDMMDTMYLTLDGGAGFRDVQCYFAESHISELAGLQKGMRVTVKGRCDGLMMNVMMKGCSLSR